MQNWFPSDAVCISKLAVDESTNDDEEVSNIGDQFEEDLCVKIYKINPLTSHKLDRTVVLTTEFFES